MPLALHRGLWNVHDDRLDVDLQKAVRRLPGRRPGDHREEDRCHDGDGAACWESAVDVSAPAERCVVARSDRGGRFTEDPVAIHDPGRFGLQNVAFPAGGAWLEHIPHLRRGDQSGGTAAVELVYLLAEAAPVRTASTTTRIPFATFVHAASRSLQRFTGFGLSPLGSHWRPVNGMPSRSHSRMRMGTT